MSFFPWRLAASSWLPISIPFFWVFPSSPDRLPKNPVFFFFVSSVLKRLRCLRRCVCFFFRPQAMFKRKCWLFIFSVGFLPQVFFLSKQNPTGRMGRFLVFLVCGETHRFNDKFWRRTCLPEVYWRSWSQSTVGIFTPSQLAVIL